MLTGLSPRQHGIVGNGWYYRDTAEIRSGSSQTLSSKARSSTRGSRPARFFVVQPNAPVRWSATPSHITAAMAPKSSTSSTIPIAIYHRNSVHFLCQLLGTASRTREHRVDRQSLRRGATSQSTRVNARLFATPRLRLPTFCGARSERVRELDRAAQIVIEAAQRIDAEVIVVSSMAWSQSINPS